MSENLLVDRSTLCNYTVFIKCKGLMCTFSKIKILISEKKALVPEPIPRFDIGFGSGYQNLVLVADYKNTTSSYPWTLEGKSCATIPAKIGSGGGGLLPPLCSGFRRPCFVPSSSCPTDWIFNPSFCPGLDFHKETWNSWYSLIWEKPLFAMCNLEERHSNVISFISYNFFCWNVDFYLGDKTTHFLHKKERKLIILGTFYYNESNKEFVVSVLAKLEQFVNSFKVLQISHFELGNLSKLVFWSISSLKVEVFTNFQKFYV